jgi:hypothetical protein
MPEKPGFIPYVQAAFNARPFGMFVAPNWIGLGAFALLGLMTPGFWVLGAGLELGYLAVLVRSARFRRTVDAGRVSSVTGEWQRRMNALMARLDDRDRRRYQRLSGRCGAILDQQLQGAEVPQGIEAQSEGLGRLSWMYLRLLAARQAIGHVLGDAERDESLGSRLTELETQVAARELGDDLRRSLASQADILRQRLAQQAEARDKLLFLDAELTRIEQQVELIREQAALSTDPELLSHRIDQITATLGGTSQWIRDQQKVYGAMEDLLTEPPPLAGSIRVGETQS